MDNIWLASYPRSGNTFLRTVLWNCFELRSFSLYGNDLGNNKALEDYVGHAEQHSSAPSASIRLTKTHEPDRDNLPAIYVVRDGRAATVSLWNFYGQQVPMEELVNGDRRFGSWSDHLTSWDPWQRPNTLLLRYEELRDNLPATVKQLAGFLDREPVSTQIPDRNTIAGADGKWVRPISNWKSILSGRLLKTFNQQNKAMLKKSGYY